MNDHEMTRDEILRALWEDYRTAAGNGQRLAAIGALERLGNMLGMFRTKKQDPQGRMSIPLHHGQLGRVTLPASLPASAAAIGRA